MMKLLAFLTLISAFIGHLSLAQDLESQWAQFKDTYGKQYRSPHEERFRKSIFADNVRFIEDHNIRYERGEFRFNLSVNKFADMTLSEFRRSRNGLIYSDNFDGPEAVVYEANDDLPTEVDWTKKGVVAPIKDQGSCGSCWAFSAVSTIESAHAIKTGKLVTLSEQEVVDCSHPQGNHGCEGGHMDNGFQFVMAHHGIDTEASYPYQGVDEPCKDNNKTIGARIIGYVDVPKKDEEAMKVAVAKAGPISVAIDASSMYFMFYRSGLYEHDDCSQVVLDHGVVIVGYGTTSDGKDYWKVRNSWGTTWGESGYIRMARNFPNLCGIADFPSYPLAA